MTEDGRDTLVLTNEVRKKCVRCGKYKDVMLFNRKGGSKDGRQSYCMDCEKEYKRMRYIYGKLARHKLQDTAVCDILDGARDLPRKDRTELSKIFADIANRLKR